MQHTWLKKVYSKSILSAPQSIRLLKAECLQVGAPPESHTERRKGLQTEGNLFPGKTFPTVLTTLTSDNLQEESEVQTMTSHWSDRPYNDLDCSGGQSLGPILKCWVWLQDPKTDPGVTERLPLLNWPHCINLRFGYHFYFYIGFLRTGIKLHLGFRL